MNDILSQLLKLQTLDIAIRTLGHDLQQIPKKSKLIDEKIREERDPFEKAAEEKEALEKERGELDESIETLDEKERSLKLRMPEIRSNQEYSALLKEMDAVKKARDEAEDRSLKALERVEELEKSLPELEEVYRKGEERVAEERKTLKGEQERLEAELLASKKERKALHAEMKPAWLSKYAHIAAARNGLAVVEVKAGTCQGCFIGVRPKLIQDLRYGEEVVFCEGCQRILHLDEDTNPV